MMKSKWIKNCLALLSITLVAGLALAVVNEITKEPIAAAEEKARSEAYETVFAGAEFEPLENAESKLALSASAIDNAGLTGCTIDDVLAAKSDDGRTIGYVMSATTPNGYGGNIQIAVGISSESGRITGFSVLSNSETAGLGAKCSEDAFTSQFAGKSAEGITYTKNGAASDTEIDAISGATITTRAVTDAVNSALAFYNEVLKEG